MIRKKFDARDYRIYQDGGQEPRTFLRRDDKLGANVYKLPNGEYSYDLDEMEITKPKTYETLKGCVKGMVKGLAKHYCEDEQSFRMLNNLYGDAWSLSNNVFKENVNIGNDYGDPNA